MIKHRHPAIEALCLYRAMVRGHEDETTQSKDAFDAAIATITALEAENADLTAVVDAAGKVAAEFDGKAVHIQGVRALADLYSSLKSLDAKHTEVE